MEIFIKLFFLTFCIFLLLRGTTASNEANVECFKKGECRESFHLQGMFVTDEFACLEFCNSEPLCKWFTFFPHSSYCEIFQDCLDLDPEICSDCLSGQPGCVPPDPTCWVQGECEGLIDHTEEDIASREDCLQLCRSTLGCKWFTYQTPPKSISATCILYHECGTIDESCTTCISGQWRCREETEPTWHLIVGGDNYTHHLSYVELFNWKTGQQCFLNDMPSERCMHVGNVLDGTPVICGGLGPRSDCIKYIKETDSWGQISDLLSPTKFAPSVVIPSKGMFIFGGYDSNLTFSQNLKTLDGKWEAGPELYESLPVALHCAVQFNETTTAFFGGTRYPRGIITFDWTTMTYTKQTTELLQNRTWTSCSLVQGRNGEHLVAVVGGQSAGTEIWNPLDGTITLVSVDFPAPTACPNCNPSLVSINNKVELLLYGGKYGDTLSESKIWKFSGFNFAWSEVGKMLSIRDDHVVLPVYDVECPATYE